jgi:hypothetical protein
MHCRQVGHGHTAIIERGGVDLRTSSSTNACSTGTFLESNGAFLESNGAYLESNGAFLIKEGVRRAHVRHVNHPGA